MKIFMVLLLSFSVSCTNDIRPGQGGDPSKFVEIPPASIVCNKRNDDGKCIDGWALPVHMSLAYSNIPISQNDPDYDATFEYGAAFGYVGVWGGRYFDGVLMHDERYVGSGGHAGVDIKAWPDRHDLFSIGYCTVRVAEQVSCSPTGWGGTIALECDTDLVFGDKIVAYYNHVHEILVEPGEKVFVGQKIGVSGGSLTADKCPGHSTGRHLHFQIQWITDIHGGEINSNHSANCTYPFDAWYECFPSNEKKPSSFKDVFNVSADPISMILGLQGKITNELMHSQFALGRLSSGINGWNSRLGNAFYKAYYDSMILKNDNISTPGWPVNNNDGGAYVHNIDGLNGGVLYIQDFYNEHPEMRYRRPGAVNDNDPGDGYSAIVAKAVPTSNGTTTYDAHLIRRSFWGAYKCLIKSGDFYDHAGVNGAVFLGAPIGPELDSENQPRVGKNCKLNTDSSLLENEKSVASQQFENGCLWHDGTNVHVHIVPSQYLPEINWIESVKCIQQGGEDTMVLDNPGDGACSDACFLGEKSCSGSYIRTCGNFNGDECTEWGGLFLCENGCSNNACISASTELSCTDGLDNDNDGAIDCNDSDCRSHLNCTGRESDCSNNLDDDLDGLIDCQDPDCAGNSSCPGSVPSIPRISSVIYQSTSNQNYISWNATVGATSYTVFWKVGPGVSLNSQQLPSTPSTNYGHTGIVEGTNYCYRVRASNANGSSDLSNEICVNVLGPVPSTPTNLQVVYQGAQNWNFITWNAASGATSYSVFWQVGPGVTTSSAMMSSTPSLEFGHSGVSAGYQYCYRVRANNTYGSSGLSNENCVTVP